MPKDQYNELQEGVAIRFLLYSPNGIAHIRGRSQRLLQVKKMEKFGEYFKTPNFLVIFAQNIE
ncbi:MAG: hypothetical protein K2G91_06510 [Prevotella sp.]|nr:hypothetical protein [Prevotella sp.]